jgi:hypothetical protein
MAEKLKALERENRELRQANEILRKAIPMSVRTRRWRSTLGGQTARFEETMTRQLIGAL